ncbi:MAG: GNAT family N-acetyltransferase [Hyphomicrobiaceae bacterium]|nr:GNAT family N-acetyltransferase [Hyphomicrobiaceae bacterium]
MDERGDVVIVPATTDEDVASVARLLRAYAASLDVDLAYQSFEDELETLPGQYAPPAGVILLARSGDGTPVGCVALRPLAATGCSEMKRLYVAPAGRGVGLGRRLAEAAIEEARRRGYREVRLDTLPSMIAAQALYRACGFEDMAAYYATPVAGTVFMRRRLTT